MTKDAQKSYTIDQNEFDRRVDRGDDPFEVARALRPAQPGPKVQGKGILPALAGIALAVLAVSLSAYLLWQMIGLQNRITGLDAKVGELSERVGQSFTTPTLTPVVALTPDKIELRTLDLSVTVGGAEKELIFVVLSGTQPVLDHPVTAKITSGPGQIEPKTTTTAQDDGTFTLSYQPPQSISSQSSVTIQISVGSDLARSFDLTLVKPDPAGITFVMDEKKQSISELEPGETGSLYLLLYGNTPTSARDVSVACAVDRSQYLTVIPSEEEPQRWDQIAQGDNKEIEAKLSTTTSMLSTDIDVKVTCIAQAENGEGPMELLIPVKILAPKPKGPEDVQNIEISVDPSVLRADGQSVAVVTVRLLDSNNELVRATVPVTMTIFPEKMGAFLSPPWKTVDGATTVDLKSGTTPGTARITASISEEKTVVKDIGLTSLVTVTEGTHFRRIPNNDTNVLISLMKVGSPLERLSQDDRSGFAKVAVQVWLRQDQIRIDESDLTGVIALGASFPALVYSDASLKEIGTLRVLQEDLQVSIIDRKSLEDKDYVIVRIEGWARGSKLSG